MPAQGFGETGHLILGFRVVVGVAIPLTIAIGFHQGRDRIAQVEGDRLTWGCGGVGRRRVVGTLHGVRLGGAGEIDRQLGEGVECLGKADHAGDLGGRGGLDHRLGIGEAHILRREDAESPGDEDGVGRPFDQAGQPVESGVRIGAARI